MHSFRDDETLDLATLCQPVWLQTLEANVVFPLVKPTADV